MPGSTLYSTKAQRWGQSTKIFVRLPITAECHQRSCGCIWLQRRGHSRWRTNGLGRSSYLFVHKWYRMSRCTSRWQVILLHGPSGTGKTATVEAIAEHFRRPLYSLAVCSLPLDTSLLVDTLTFRLDAARSWNAIVLIEAGDVRYFACFMVMSWLASRFLCRLRDTSK